ncbi:MAG TPA: DUF1330 domain-containing protein [Thermoanaerobaculia bacterium]|nr:DUF1330 domain-containing protein [Thermoanaerobaculia bacterium]
MAAYVFVEVDVRDPQRYETYKQMAPPAIELYGGKYLVRGPKVEVLEGSWSPQRCVILEFPSVEAARTWWESPEYLEAKRLRQQTAETRMILLQGL